MREVFTHQDPTVLGLYKSLLEAEGIAAFIRNEHSTTIGQGFYGMFQNLPFLDPVLCIVDDESFDQAVRILEAHRHPAPGGGPDWLCPQCQEAVPGSFDQCWNCEAPKPEV